MMKQKLPKPTVEDHFRNAPESLKRILGLLRIKINKLEYVQEYATRAYIGYKLKAYKTLFVEMHIQRVKMKIVLHLRPVEYNDPSIETVPDSYKWTLNKLLYIDYESDIDYVMNLVEQSYNNVL
jgi:predicted transport protein